jgi:hypothetical protein
MAQRLWVTACDFSNTVWWKHQNLRGAGSPIHNPDFVNAIHNLWMPFTKCQEKILIFVRKITPRKLFFSKSTYFSTLEFSTTFSQGECLSEIFSKYFVNWAAIQPNLMIRSGLNILWFIKSLNSRNSAVWLYINKAWYVISRSHWKFLD